jgi:hypothetical protein
LVLLGRPFDAIGESVVRNSKSGGQTITITDPNTGEHLTMPTFERGQRPTIMQREPRPQLQNEEGFYYSMI